jgi:hypothetical protein
MRKSTGWVIIILLLAAAYFLNPGYSKHTSKLGMGALETQIKSNPNVANVTQHIVKYNNYYLFSTTTNTITGQRLTFGLFGMVFR